MLATELLHKQLEESCSWMHKARRQALGQVVQGVLDSQSLVGAHIGRKISGHGLRKHKIKKVNRLLGNGKLQGEVSHIYKSFAKKIVSCLPKDNPIIVLLDLCYLKEERGIVQISAALATKGHSIPLLEQVVSGDGAIKKQARYFIRQLKAILPKEQEVIVVMDAGFYDQWLDELEKQKIYWLTRVRTGRSVYILDDQTWYSARAMFGKAEYKPKDWGDVLLTKSHQRRGRLISVRRKLQGKKRYTTTRMTVDGHKVSKEHSRSHREPWLLVTNLPASRFDKKKIIKLYEMRMRIELMFRDTKSYRYGLSAHCVVSRDVGRWQVLMLLSAIARWLHWLIGSIGRTLGKQREYQANSCYDKRVFSEVYLGMLLLEHDPGWVKTLDIIKGFKNILGDLNYA